MQPENISASLVLELSDIWFHVNRAGYWHARLVNLQPHAIETYQHEIAYHTERYNAHYSNAIGWASR